VDQADVDFAGSMQWHKRARKPFPASQGRVVRYGNEIKALIEFRGVNYKPTPSPLVLQSDRSVSIILEGGDLSAPVLVPAISYLDGFILPNSYAHFTVAYINARTGMVRGEFPHPSGSESTPMFGIVNQKLNEVHGGFMGPDHGGRIRVIPRAISGPGL
jgi:hypothetical protein